MMSHSNFQIQTDAEYLGQMSDFLLETSRSLANLKIDLFEAMEQLHNAGFEDKKFLNLETVLTQKSENVDEIIKAYQIFGSQLSELKTIILNYNSISI